ncbi:MAG: hypothetical protein AB7I30_20140 [Isosphaeraceae bacterium]
MSLADVTTLELRDPAEARRFLSQAVWLRSLASPNPRSAGVALRWAIELASRGEPIPPIGVIADLGHLLLDRGGSTRAGHEFPAIPGWPSGLTRRYEDLVLGKLDADPTIARASDALARYRGRDRDRGLAFVIDRIRVRANHGGILLSPAALKSALESPQDLLAAGWESLATDGVVAALPALYERLIASVREMHDALGPEDVFELEHGTALAEFGQRVALRQVLRCASGFEAVAPRDRPRLNDRRQDVATRVVDEDTYPVGGFTSISTHGSVESLLHSQLAYMEADDRPDLFDIKYARDELLYYSRDENQFFRRRRSVVVALHPDLTLARVKDPELPFQRIVLLLGLLVALVRRLSDWLSDEALVFEFLFVRPGGLDVEPLAPERGLLTMLFREAIANGTVVVDLIDGSKIESHRLTKSRRGLCLALDVSTIDHRMDVQGLSSAVLRLDQARPALGFDESSAETVDAEDAPSSWQAALDLLLAAWA